MLISFSYDLFIEAGVTVDNIFSDKEHPGQVGVGSVLTSGRLAGEMVSTLAQSAKDGFDSCSSCNISHFHPPPPPITLVTMTRIL